MIIGIMATIVEIDSAGRIVVPKKLRDALHLTPGTRLNIHQAGDALILQHDFPAGQMERIDGFWVLTGGAPLDDEATKRIRQETYEERHHRILEGSGLE